MNRKHKQKWKDMVNIEVLILATSVFLFYIVVYVELG